MSEPKPSTDASEATAEGWRWRPTSRTDVAVNGVLALVLLIAGLMIGDEPVDRLPAPPTTADPVPAGPLIRAHRPDCGISRATLDALVPHPERTSSSHSSSQTNCGWRAGGHELDRRLTVSIVLYADSRQGRFAGHSTTPVTEAMAAFAAAVFQRPEPPGKKAKGDKKGEKPPAVKWRAVTGLGDEAGVSYYSRHSPGDGSVFARIRNATVKVTYSGTDTPSLKALPEKTAVDGALKAATEVARGLGITVNRPPSITGRTEEPVPARPPVNPCALVSGRTRETLLGDADEERLTSPVETGRLGEKTDGCRWEGEGTDDANYTYFVEVSLTTHPTVAAAERGYLARHLTARAEEPISEGNEKYFAAVTGLGEQAYASFTEEGLPGGTVFRIRNIVVSVTYSQQFISYHPPGGGEPLSRDQSVNGAYAAAKDVAAALRAGAPRA